MATEYRAQTLPGVEVAMDTFTGEVMGVHPVAALFPMLDDDDLAALADDIKAHGQVYPILRDADGQIIDGRNRQAACILAGVEPWYETWTGDDPAAYILSANVERRHLTKNQRAIAIAQTENLAVARFRHGAVSQLAADADVDRNQVYMARVVVQYVPDLAPQVMGGASLRGAYDYAIAVKRQQDEAEAERARVLKREAQQFKQLQQDAPALAAQVTSGALTIAQAVAAADVAAQQRAQAPERERLLAAIQLAQEEIGAPVPLPERPPNLDYRLVADADGQVEAPKPNAPGDLTRLRAEEAFLRELIAVRKQLAQVVDRAPVEDSGWSEGTVKGVRSAASAIIALAYEMVQRHEHAAQEAAGLRSVK